MNYRLINKYLEFLTKLYILLRRSIQIKLNIICYYGLPIYHQLKCRLSIGVSSALTMYLLDILPTIAFTKIHIF